MHHYISNFLWLVGRGDSTGLGLKLVKLIPVVPVSGVSGWIKYISDSVAFGHMSTDLVVNTTDDQIK